MSKDDSPRRINPLFVASLAKGIRVLRAFDETHTEMGLSEIAARIGMEKSAVQRLANTLFQEGMLDKDPVTRRFRPSHAWLEMAYCYSWSDPLIAAALPKLIDLLAELDQTINLAELSGDHIIYVSRLPVKRTYFAASIVGRRLPALSTSAGRSILATFPRAEREAAVREWPLRPFTAKTTMDRGEIMARVEEAAEQGYAISRDQMILNEIGIAAPIINADGRAAAAIQCSVSALSFDNEALRQKILPALLDTTRAIAPAGR